ncbi:RNA polymerase sigma factor [Ideonella sp.]|uniref:RNA polymerase sigma factor n=1 Tax=Ideonella sp. TaxID=1929293 RepID=UPI002B488B02|nr:RNA polymerase sigma factor [Ideonella sp.]HJV72282.1 RNA polymerase sigma factor [Ideonella sp.]
MNPVPTHPEIVFRDLMQQHRTRLVHFVRRQVGDDAEAEDLAQQAFADAARAYAGFRGDSQLSTWLYGIALNLARNHQARSPSRRHRFEDASQLDDMPCGRPDPSEQCELDQLMRRLARELDALSPDMREVLWLVSVDELAYEDAAARLSLPVGTVRSRVSRARSQLRRRFLRSGAALPF